MTTLSPEEFAAAVMKNGTEIEYDEYHSCNRCGGSNDYSCDDNRPCDDFEINCPQGCIDCPKREQCTCYTCDCCDAWEVYAHIKPDGTLQDDYYDAYKTITIVLHLSMEDSDKLQNGKLDEVEKEAIIEDLYPKYLEVLKEIKEEYEG